MNKKLITTMILSVILCFQLFSFNTYAEKEMRGVWVSTVYNLDFPSRPTTDAQQLRNETVEILDNCKAMGMNAVFLQVRAASDSFYKSSIYPWSQWLTGSQGTAPSDDFDPLRYWISEAHERGIEVHAWVNPYRATKNSAGGSLSSLALNNPARQHPEYCVLYSDGNYYYDPALPEVRQLVIDGIKEIIDNYDVDGIHMDDYFYPGTSFNDDASYQKYNRGISDRGDWRRDNVNLLIKGIKEAVDSSGKDIDFGISPCGIWANKSSTPYGSDTAGMEAYYQLYADTRLWAQSEWIDYIAPQIYWEIGFAIADYKVLADWWSDVVDGTSTKLYTGLADYRADGGTGKWYNGAAIGEQLQYNDTVKNVDGEIHFRYKLMTGGVRNIVTDYYASHPDDNGEQATQQTTAVQPVTEQTTAPQTVTEQTTQPTTESSQAETDALDYVVDPMGVYVRVNGRLLTFDQKPIIENGRTLVPFRAIFEALGADVSWNNDTQQVTAKRGDSHISLIIGDKNMLVNYNQIVQLDVPPKILNGRTMVPLRAVSEAYGANVSWDNSKRLVTIELAQ